MTLNLSNRAPALNIRGLTLIEVLCLLAIAILLLILVMPRYGHGGGNARWAATMTQLATFQTQLGAFRADNGFYPAGTNGLRELVRQPAGTTNWHGPYAQDVPKDPWGQDYVYGCPGKHVTSGYPYDLLSLGSPGENKPIANWANPSLKP